MAPLRPALLLLLAALGALAVPCCCGARRDTRDSNTDSLMLVGPENVARPSRPKVFTSPEELRGYLEALSNYYAIAGRPRFGKRAPALRAIYDVSSYRHFPGDTDELLEPQLDD